MADQASHPHRASTRGPVLRRCCEASSCAARTPLQAIANLAGLRVPPTPPLEGLFVRSFTHPGTGPGGDAKRAPPKARIGAPLEGSPSKAASRPTRQPPAATTQIEATMLQNKLSSRGAPHRSHAGRVLAPATSAVRARASRSTLRCAAVAESRVLKTVNVDLGDRSYPIYIGNGLLDSNAELLRKHIPGKRVLVVTNDTIAPLYLEK
eukprot:144860-Chlamydomonas_euryale.AAC.5